MSRPIHFNGVEYASRDAMPPAVQAAFDQYKQAQESELLNELAEAEHPAAAAAPAWGGAPAAGGVPVPVEFDPVTSLGPATAVYPPQGARLPSLGTPRADALVLYRDGLAWRAGQAVHAWRWETVAVIQSNVWFSGRAHINYEFTLTTDSGEHVILDNTIKNVDDALDDVKRAVVQRRLPAARQAYDAGQPLTYGPVTIHKQNGLTLDGKLYAWPAIMEIKVDRGSFIVTERTNKQHAARAKDMPNIELLAALIGLKFNQAMLAYYQPMSTPIHFHGADYPSVEAMPPDVRAAYDKLQQAKAQLSHGLDQMQHGLAQMQHGLDQAQPGGPGAAATPAPAVPAWGGAPAAGGVPVPVEFDPVTSLGPATHVYEHDGLRLLPTFGPPHPNALVLYHDGFAFRAGKELHTWRWEEVAVSVSDLSISSGSHGSAWTEHTYTLTKSSGEKVVLDSGIKGVQSAAEAIKKAATARLLPPLRQAYDAYQPVSFGPVSAHKQTGLTVGGKTYAWDAIQDVKIHRGRFTVTLRTGQKHEARAKDLPNIEALAGLIGLTFLEPDLAYY